MNDKRKSSGFVLIELVSTLILVGIIGSFTGFFLYTGIQGYLTSKKTSVGALQAQTALERVSKELSALESLPTVQSKSISYTSRTLPGQRSISFDDNTGVISITVDGSSYPLLKDVGSFSLSGDTADLNGDGNADEISVIAIAFTVGEIGRQFSTAVYPRGFFTAP